MKLKLKKNFVLIAAIIILIFLVISIYSSIPYFNTKNLKLEQGIYTDAIKFNASNPTNFPAIFPETDLEVYLDEIHYGNLKIEETLIPSKQSKILPAKFTLNEEGLKQLEQKTRYIPSIVKYEGTATTYFFGIKSTMPFELKKTLTNQDMVMG